MGHAQSSVRPAVSLDARHNAMFVRRTTDEVLRDHLQLRLNGDIDTDVVRNYALDVVLVTAERCYYGHRGILESAALLNDRIAGAAFEYVTVRVERELGFLEWKAEGQDVIVTDGRDTFLIRGGEILVQTVHYTITRRS